MTTDTDDAPAGFSIDASDASLALVLIAAPFVVAFMLGALAGLIVLGFRLTNGG